MTREQAKQEIRSKYKEYLQPAKKKNTYICPLCNNGTGTDGDGMTVDPHGDGYRLHCFKCGFHGDIIDLYQQQQSCTIAEAFEGLYSYFNMDIENTAAESRQKPQEARSEPQAANYTQEEKTDYTAYFKACRERMNTPAALEYLSFRGISPETAERFWIGYDPEWKSPAAVKKGKKPPASPRLIIPTSASSYIARETRQEPSKYAKMKEGEVNIFNAKALYNEQESPVFITEGEIDALSIIEAGKEAVGLGSASNLKKLLEKLKEKSTSNTLILCLDKDEAGQKAEQEIAGELQRLNIAFVRADISGEYKDPNEALTANKAAFVAALEAAEQQTAAKPDNIKDYLSRIFAGEVEHFKKSSTRKTGFSNLDEKAGGIYPGLYVLGAISSLGKTTFIHQMADQMAAAGEHILFFSLEQSRFEMASKSLARLTAKDDIRTAVSSLEIRKGNFTPAVEKAYKEYCETVADRLSIIEGNFNCNLSFIGDYVRRYMKKNGVKPVVVVDYLQILDGSSDQRQTTKDIVDTNVRELKRLSRNEDIPVIVISSLNRSNYLTPVDFESFKESGGIEYTADVIWGLQLAIMNDELFDKEKKLKEKRERVREAKAENPRKIQLVCLKNRYGVSSYTADFLYYPAHDLYSPDDWNEWETITGEDPFTQSNSRRA